MKSETAFSTRGITKPTHRPSSPRRRWLGQAMDVWFCLAVGSSGGLAIMADSLSPRSGVGSRYTLANSPGQAGNGQMTASPPRAKGSPPRVIAAPSFSSRTRKG